MSTKQGPTCSAWRSTSWATCSGASTKTRSTPPAKCSPAPAGSPSMAAGARRCRSRASRCGCSISACRSSVVGDMTTPALGKGDVFLVTSGPGETSTVLALMKVAKKAGARNLLLTAEPDKQRRQACGLHAAYPGADHGQRPGRARPLRCCRWARPIEGALFVLFEIMVLKLKALLDVSPEAMRARHTNME